MSDPDVEPVAEPEPSRRLRLGSPAVWLLAALAYLPALTASPGRVPTDTKLYLYLSPGRLIADAPFTWDTRQFAGWVPHQTIAYLWPSGPWFWTFEQLGVPDWIAHRLWIGTLLFLGGLGIRWAARLLGLPATGALVAAVVYQLSPYVLPYISRTSVMLLPWAAVGWLVGLTIRACGRRGWRDVGLFALVVFTVGAVNATAIALIAPAPVLWILHAGAQRLITWRNALVTAAKLGAASLLVSLWWIVMVAVQGRYGADVLAFSESLEAVSLTSVSTETLRGLGYWLFYVRDPFAFTTTASVDYLNSPRTLLVGFTLLVVCLAGIAAVRWSQRRYAALLVGTGIVLGVGFHPYDDPSPLMAPFRDSGIGLALRSSTRALPLSNFGLALGAGALVTAIAARQASVTDTRPASRWPAWRWPGWRIVVPGLVVLLAVLNLPALWNGGFVDEALEREQDVPPAWTEAAAVLDEGSTEYRVMLLPGSEFGAFRWGYTVDPPLPGLTDKPLVTRDLLPLGSPGAMDLLYALDNRFQAGTIDAASVAVVARLLGVDTIWVPNDIAFERFRTPRPEIVADFFHRPPPGLDVPESFGEPAVNEPLVPMIDEQTLSDPRIGTALPPVDLASVEDAVAIVRASSQVVLVAGSGDGLVDAAGAGLIEGDEAILYAADLSADERAALLAEGTPLVVTDSNRDRAMQWRGSQDTLGMTERGGVAADATEVDVGDERLAVFASQDPAHQTTATLDGGVQVSASAYGEPFAYRPEDRPAMAVDGDPATAWVVADRADPVGQSITLTGAGGSLTLLQSQDPVATRRISRVRITAEGASESMVVDLDERSWAAPGQAVGIGSLTTSPDSAVTITIDAVALRPEGTDSGPTAVGFAELGPVAAETVNLPSDALSQLDADTPVTIVLTRERTRPTDRWRDDPERSITRGFDLPVGREFEVSVTVRLDDRAADAVLDSLSGSAATATATSRLTGVPDARGSAAVDGDASTGWTSAFGPATGTAITVGLDGTPLPATLTLRQPVDGLHSTITSLRADVDGTVVELAVPAPDGDGISTVEIPAPAAGLPAASVTFTVTGVAPLTTVDRRYGEIVQLPVSIVEIDGLSLAPGGAPGTADCRSDLVMVDGEALPLAVDDDDLADLAAGEPATLEPCDDAALELAPGGHRITTATGTETGIQIDRIVLDGATEASSSATPTAPAAPTVTVSRTRSERTATVSGCADGCWLILGEGYNAAWEASIDGDDELGAPTQISGGFNGWWLPPGDDTRVVNMRWTPQRTLQVALGLATLGILACIAVVIADRRKRTSSIEIEGPTLALPWATSTRRASIVAGAALVVLSGLVIAPLWAAIAVVPAAAIVALRRPRLGAWAAPALAGVLGLLIVRRQFVYEYAANAGWTGAFEDLHRAGLFVAVLLAASCLVDDEAFVDGDRHGDRHGDADEDACQESRHESGQESGQESSR